MPYAVVMVLAAAVIVNLSSVLLLVPALLIVLESAAVLLMVVMVSVMVPMHQDRHVRIMCVLLAPVASQGVVVIQALLTMCVALAVLHVSRVLVVRPVMMAFAQPPSLLQPAVIT
jgi:hypothetical protein